MRYMVRDLPCTSSALVSPLVLITSYNWMIDLGYVSMCLCLNQAITNSHDFNSAHPCSWGLGSWLLCARWDFFRTDLCHWHFAFAHGPQCCDVNTANSPITVHRSRRLLRLPHRIPCIRWRSCSTDSSTFAPFIEPFASTPRCIASICFHRRCNAQVFRCA